MPTDDDITETSSSSDDNPEEPSKEKEPIQVGMTSLTKDLYRDDYRQPWQEWAPEDIGINSKSTPASLKFALIVRREKQNGDTEEPVLALHSVAVQSPLIKTQLDPVFAGYRGINTKLKKLEFRAPFREFFYRWSEFIQAEPKTQSDEQENIGHDHYKLLFDIISTEVQPHIEQAGDLLSNNVISFDYVWALFEPGTEVYSHVDGHDRLYLLNGGTYQELPGGVKIFNLSCRYIDTDGDTFGYRTTSLAIGEFENVQPISELNVLPSHLKPDIESIRSRLEERGRKFAALKGFHYKSYSGAYDLHRPSYGAPRKQYVADGRIVVDCSSFLKYNGGPLGQLDPLDQPVTSEHLSRLSLLTGIDDSDEEADMFLPPPIRMMQQRARQMRQRFNSLRTQSKVSESLFKEHYPLCSPVVKGFCLKIKDWVHFDVDLVKDIVWDDGAFEQLVLPHDYKRVIWAFVEAQMSNVDDFDDIIGGKGKGIIMLLSGEPGTGKTLTSESVSEAMKKPLYSMSAGELGHGADEVEQNLRRVLELSTKWGAVLLLDECDVFLEKRSTSDLHRNKLVSVFLRLLEYYQGVMFLTTNRASSFDPAFESRIHLTIHFPNLDFPSRLHIWKIFINPSSGRSCSVSEVELESLAKAELNGRQIKNVVKTARLLAARDKTPLSLDHIETVMRVKRGDPARFADA
ncbi:hypothetical protein CkaCkLH20_10532 [Colletotrichum karsti]|uniref:AAA+ ATPase domain-containing protein n=1 Tax=Colletotrichum karsti TaxID=1095194 RepID=A0A9P6I4N5_9PEZI|nr:uncharacterized protein CkaCkLH20_10532 [Colletotrichum karsti]KAF9871900.1 hypothetical protein CkaCkLH20_10532 [Colletotrichum karsti]